MLVERINHCGIARSRARAAGWENCRVMSLFVCHLPSLPALQMPPFPPKTCLFHRIPLLRKSKTILSDDVASQR